MSARILSVFATTHGHTGKIAHRITLVLREQGTIVREHELGTATARLDLSQFDAIVVGASIHVGHHQAEMIAWVTERAPSLNALPSAFFSVSLTAADDGDEARETTQALVEDFLETTGWTPTLTRTFAGAFQFREYALPTRVLMRLMARRVEHKTGTTVDVHEDTDYTDWKAVDELARSFHATVEERALVMG